MDVEEIADGDTFVEDEKWTCLRGYGVLCLF